MSASSMSCICSPNTAASRWTTAAIHTQRPTILLRPNSRNRRRPRVSNLAVLMICLGKGYRARGTLSFLLQKRAVFRFGFGFFGRDDHRCGNLVFFLKMQQADALRGPASSADGLGIHANDLAVLADDHEFRGFIDQQDGAHLAVARRRLDVDNAPATAGL